MGSKCRNGKSTIGSNQPPSRRVNDSVFDKPLDFPTFDFSGIYSPHIPSQSTLDPTYTSSPETPDPNQDSSLNEELCGVTLEAHVYRIPNNKVD